MIKDMVVAALGVIAAGLMMVFIVSKYNEAIEERDALRELVQTFPPAEIDTKRKLRQAWLKAGRVNGMKVYVVMEEAYGD